MKNRNLLNTITYKHKGLERLGNINKQLGSSPDRDTQENSLSKYLDRALVRSIRILPFWSVLGCYGAKFAQKYNKSQKDHSS